AAQYQPRVERGAAQAQGVDDVANALSLLLMPRDDGAPDDVGMPVEILRRRVHDQVDAEFKRYLAVGLYERIAVNRQRADRPRDVYGGLDIDQVQQRVAGCFDPDALCTGRGRLANVVDILHVDERKREAVIGEW